jgi:hypothetical protein
MNKLSWEVICYNQDKSYNTSRAEVFGGWLVKVYGEDESSLTFVPDPNHEWSLEK